MSTSSVMTSSINETNYYGMCTSDSQCVNSVEQNEFGHFQETYDWIECESISYPGKIYFFNLRTHCRTWVKPVPESVRLVRFKRNSKVYNNFSSDENHTDNLVMVISSESEKDTGYSKNKSSTPRIVKKRRSRKISLKDSKVVTHSYSNVSITKFSSSDHGFSNENSNSEGNKISKSFNLTTAAKCKLVASKSGPDVTDANKQLKRENDIKKEEKENGVIQNSSPVHCKKIKSSDSLIGKEESKMKQMQRKVKKSSVKKTIREMYGIKTINYDPIDRELPPGVKIACLSESSINSSLRQTDDLKSCIENNYKFFDDNFHVNLSSATSSSTCSSSCPYFSTPSDTNSSSSWNHSVILLS